MPKLESNDTSISQRWRCAVKRRRLLTSTASTSQLIDTCNSCIQYRPASVTRTACKRFSESSRSLKGSCTRNSCPPVAVSGAVVAYGGESRSRSTCLAQTARERFASPAKKTTTGLPTDEGNLSIPLTASRETSGLFVWLSLNTETVSKLEILLSQPAVSTGFKPVYTIDTIG